MIVSEDKAQVGLVITQGRIALVLSIITLLGVFYQGTKFILDSQYRISSLEEKWTGLDQTQKNLTLEIGKLSTAIADLNVVLRGVEVRQQQVEKGVNR